MTWVNKEVGICNQNFLQAKEKESEKRNNCKIKNIFD